MNKTHTSAQAAVKSLFKEMTYYCKHHSEMLPQFFTETSQVGEASQSFEVLYSISVCLKEAN